NHIAVSTGLTHDRTDHMPGGTNLPLHEPGHPHMEPPANPARFSNTLRLRPKFTTPLLQKTAFP
ncbi:hypothetical protein OC539_26045, partial [Paracoccus denitrificans]|uniref:hypothetical protein n=1 Tax=Paracoccus denitrificans TaxID=266 RepID=UPI0021D4DCA2